MDDLDRRIAKAERACAALGLSAGSRMDAAAGHREQQYAVAARRPTSGVATPSSPTESPLARPLISPTRNLLGYAERHKVKPQWKESLEKFRDAGRGSPAAMSSVASPTSSIEDDSSTSYHPDSSALVSQLRQENHRLRVQLCTPTPRRRTSTKATTLDSQQSSPAPSPLPSPLRFDDLETQNSFRSVSSTKKNTVKYIITRRTKRKNEQGRSSSSSSSKDLAPGELHRGYPQRQHQRRLPSASTMDTLRQRENDLCNIFLHFSQCDANIRAASLSSGHAMATSLSSSRKYFWEESQFKQFLREFDLLSLFGVRASINLFRLHATPSGSTNSNEITGRSRVSPRHVRNDDMKKKIPGYRMSFSQFMWCLCALCNDLPWGAGATPEQRASLFLIGLDKGLVTKIAMTRSTIRIARPKRSWISRTGRT